MPLRIGFDMDGVLADMASAYREMDARLFGPSGADADAPEGPDGASEGKEPAKVGPSASAEASAALRALKNRREIVWHAIRSAEDFWTTLKPMEEGAVRRIAEVTARYRWEAFFITQRPDTNGDSAQRQTQRWLVAQGFDLPSVIVVEGSRGRIAAALEMDYLVDDTSKNCVDVRAESPGTRSILIVRRPDLSVEQNARWLNIAVTRSVGEALDILERAQVARGNPTLFERLARAVGWNA